MLEKVINFTNDLSVKYDNTVRIMTCTVLPFSPQKELRKKSPRFVHNEEFKVRTMALVACNLSSSTCET